MPSSRFRHSLKPCAALTATAVLSTALAAVSTTAAQAADVDLRMSVESGSVKDSAGASWNARSGFIGGNYWRPATFDVRNTNDDTLLQSEIWGMTGWSTPVPAGDYEVTLRGREATFNKPGQRVFSVSAEGRPVLTDVDLMAQVGFRTAWDRTFRVSVTDGSLDLGFSAKVDQPLVSAIRVRKVADPVAPTPSPAPTLSFSTGATSATLTWTSSANPAAGWHVARDGVDSAGYGAWGTTLTGDKRSQSFTQLVPGKSYTLTLRNESTKQSWTRSVSIPTGQTPTPTPKPTPTPAPTPTPTPTPTLTPPTQGTGSAAQRLMGTTRSGLPWHSGAWVAAFTPAKAEEWGTFRGSKSDAITAFSNKESWTTIANSQWNVNTFNGFQGRFVYGLSIVPFDKAGSLTTVARGDQDWVWQAIARDLVANGRGNAVIRVGWEANGDWWPWNATASTAADYRAAFRRVATTIKKTAPNVLIDYDITCGTPLRGQTNRLDALTKLYPGDDVVDIIGCDHYDWWNTKSTNEATWQASIRPSASPGLADVAEFARARGKGMSVPEWGPAATSVQGAGDNPYFIRKMFEFFSANKDVMAYENYFNEPDTHVMNSLIAPVQMPNSAAEYKRLW